MVQKVQIQRSTGTTPPTLLAGELGYCEGNDALYIGTIGGGVIRVGGGSGLVYSNGTAVDVVSTAVKTAIATIPVPGGTLQGNHGAVKIEVTAEYFNDSGATRTLTIEIAYGGTVMYAEVTTAQTAVATNRHPVFFDLTLSNAGATNAQVLGGDITMGNAAATTTGAGDLAAVITNATGFSTAIRGTAAVDSTASQNIVISVTHPASNANLSFKKLAVLCYVPGKGLKGDVGAPGSSGAGTVNVPTNFQTGTTYTADVSDVGKKIKCTNASPITLTIPPSTYSADDVFYVAQGGAGAVTLAPGAGVTLNKPHTLVTGGIHALLTVHCEGSDVFHVWGEST